MWQQSWRMRKFGEPRLRGRKRCKKLGLRALRRRKMGAKHKEFSAKTCVVRSWSQYCSWVSMRIAKPREHRMSQSWDERSEERRVGKECGCRRGEERSRKKEQ